MHVQEEYGKNEDIVAIVTIFFIVSFAQYNCMSLIDFREQILKLKDFNEAYELVKLTVNTKFNMQRAGLSLILQGLPSRIGAYHILGSNVIVVNRTILDIIRQHKSIEEYNSYLFMVLAHEYLHSFGIVDEFRVRQMSY
ncbi:MAG: hypothetical protein WBE61_03315, partial [Nitrososphaeraceae archaeon]